MLKCGFVGLPNVGKSTLFNALTKMQIEAQNYPFCTIEPNSGLVEVRDIRLDKVAQLAQSQKTIYTFMQCVDIAGLVEGASKGEGLGNKFLSHIRDVDAIVHVIRCFEDHDITHVLGSIDPVRDLQIIEGELLLADLESVEKRITKQQKLAKSGDKAQKALLENLETVKEHLETEQPLRTMEEMSPENPLYHEFITSKPMMYAANIKDDYQQSENNTHVQELQKHAQEKKADVIVINASLEAELGQLSDQEAQMFLEDMGLEQPILERFIHQAYSFLGLETYFTAGPKEARAWTIKKNTLAPAAAGKIHSDFERGFISAEVVSFDDYIEHQTEAQMKKAGKWRIEGKTYVVQDADVILFRFNV